MQNTTEHARAQITKRHIAIDGVNKEKKKKQSKHNNNNNNNRMRTNILEINKNTPKLHGLSADILDIYFYFLTTQTFSYRYQFKLLERRHDCVPLSLSLRVGV